MILTLIGMSGVGKSFWSNQLVQRGFQHFDCDHVIATKIGPRIGQQNPDWASIAKWMGFPDQEGFQQRESIYIASETETVYDALAYAKYCHQHQIDVVIDTGGSAIYAGEEAFNQLKCYSTVIYLMISQEIYQQMVSHYIANPRSLIWNNHFYQQAEESFQEACIRCYPQLVCQREQLYMAYSHIQFDYDYHYALQHHPDQFLRAVQQALEA